MYFIRVAAVLVSFSLSSFAVADEPTDAAAKRYFQSGTKHFDLTEYREALNDFKEAYRLRQDPVLLYNVAQCHRLMNEPKEALRFYRSYLNRAPAAPNRAEVERRIATLEAAVAAATTAPEPAPSPSKSETIQQAHSTSVAMPVSTIAHASHEPGASPVYKRWWLWTTVAVVVVGVAVGVGVGVVESRPAPWKTSFPTVTF